MSKVSKVYKVKEVQSIRLTDYIDKEAHVQAVLINPKWKVEKFNPKDYESDQSHPSYVGSQKSTGSGLSSEKNA
jgi:hypothetical protein